MTVDLNSRKGRWEDCDKKGREDACDSDSSMVIDNTMRQLTENNKTQKRWHNVRVRLNAKELDILDKRENGYPFRISDHTMVELIVREVRDEVRDEY